MSQASPFTLDRAKQKFVQQKLKSRRDIREAKAKMFSKLTTILQHAVEVLAPNMPRQEDFVYHWKAITHYYIETSDDKAPVTDTNIPAHLEQMVSILAEEETERETGETGPCMEYLLQHKILETLFTLSRADCPPGMKQQVLIFFSKLLGRIQQPILPHINVHRPVLKLIRLCGEVLAAPTENEEIQFLCIVCAKLKQDPYLVNFFMENKSSNVTSSLSNSTNSGPLTDNKTTLPDGIRSEGSTTQCGNSKPGQNERTFEEINSSPGCANAQKNAVAVGATASSGALSPAPSGQEYNLVHSLLNLINSPDGRIAVKACEGLMLLVSLPEASAARCLTDNTALCRLLAGRLVSLHAALPTSLDPLDLESLQTVNWGLDTYSHKEDMTAFHGKRALISFLSWLDYCDQLIKEAHQIIATAIATTIREQYFTEVLEPKLMQTSEVGILTSTTLLTRLARQVSSPALLEQLVLFLLGDTSGSEVPGAASRHSLRDRLIERCDHISDEISIGTLKLFETLLQKPQMHVLQNLALRNLEERNYTEYKPPSQEDHEIAENGQIAGAVDLEEDPMFADMLSGGQGFSGSDWLSHSPVHSPDHGKDGKTEVHKVVNSFLCLVPDEAKSSYQLEGSGYDTYLRDAHRQFRECCVACQHWDWPVKPKAIERCNLDAPFFEGQFFKVLFDRMARILDQPYDVNLQVTSVLSKLALYPHPHLHEYLLDPYINLAPGCRSLFSVIVRVVGDLMLRIQRIPDFSSKMMLVRRRLLGTEPEGSPIDHLTLLEGVIVLEEFCKELAAIAFVKHHAASVM
ncbi:FHF complex subunit HOOK interacting protein 2A isoform X2 [Petromyzon marinus]|uniref:Protein FAM160B1 isoform X2 n=1 Tax=Petromyzon marinus TaxID=7757 RepID=A0AAJ7WSI8_PETMA|nr:protein FAM160B1 isoform X2 [Petromyzon marinus]